MRVRLRVRDCLLPPSPGAWSNHAPACQMARKNLRLRNSETISPRHSESERVRDYLF